MLILEAYMDLLNFVGLLVLLKSLMFSNVSH